MSIGQIKDYTPNFNLIIPRFDIATWHDYMESNFRSIDALFFNMFGINQYRGEWQNSTTYQVGDVLFIGDPDSQYTGRLVKVLVVHTTTANDSFDVYYAHNPINYDLFMDAAAAEQAAKLARDWAIKTDGKVQGLDYSSKYYANLITPISSEIVNVSNISNEVINVSSISSNITSVDSNSTNINTVANNINSVNTNATNITDINTNASNISSINTTATNISNINTTALNINDVNTTAGITNDISTVANNSSAVTTVANDINNINNVANDLTNINDVNANKTNIDIVASNSSNISTVSTNISDVNTAAANITAIQNAPTYATNAANSADLAQDWATKMNGLVDNVDYSSKYYAQIASQNADALKIGQIISSILPLNSAGVHLLDGSLLQSGGIYQAFIDYIANLYTTYPQCFTTEADWQRTVNAYGSCGKFVYDSVNNTVRLPKITGFIEGTINSNALGDLVEAGLPNITGNIYKVFTNGQSGDGVFSATPVGLGNVAAVEWDQQTTYNFDASRSSAIYGKSSTVQPQSIKVYYYIVLATTIKTDIEVDIDEIVTDLNDKVSKTQNETITGTKTFTGSLTIPSNTLITKQDNNLKGGQIVFQKANNDPLTQNPVIDLYNGDIRFLDCNSVKVPTVETSSNDSSVATTAWVRNNKFPNNTWNPVGDDAFIGDRNHVGAVCFKGNTGNTTLLLINRAENVALGFYVDENDSNALKLTNPTYNATAWGSVTAMITSNLITANKGYVKFNHGLIIQWGLNTNGDQITFLTPYTTNPCVSICGNNSSGNTETASSAVGTVSTTGFKLLLSRGGWAAQWIAIGH